MGGTLCEIGEVNYRIEKEGKGKHSKVVHVNCLKRYWESGSICRLGCSGRGRV